MSTESASRPVLREYLEALLIAVIFATFARTFVFQAFKIPSGSMENNLLIGDHILVNKFIYGPVLLPFERALLPSREVRRGDVVVFRFPQDPSRDFIKRAVGIPGDTVQLIDKHLFINGRRVADESYTRHADPGSLAGSLYGSHPRDNFGPVRVPAASYFCMGDNRDNSHDSRFWGMVPESYLKGRALLVYWSFAETADDLAEITGAGAEPGGGHLLRHVGHVLRNFLSATRWNRTFKIIR